MKPKKLSTPNNLNRVVAHLKWELATQEGWKTLESIRSKNKRKAKKTPKFYNEQYTNELKKAIEILKNFQN